VQDEGIDGVICGRSIYEGTLDLQTAQARADELTGVESDVDIEDEE
jgi:phosphoribosylformimino-5-aminoimidazole carboxamide ribotide isomerase